MPGSIIVQLMRATWFPESKSQLYEEKFEDEAYMCYRPAGQMLQVSLRRQLCERWTRRYLYPEDQYGCHQFSEDTDTLPVKNIINNPTRRPTLIFNPHTVLRGKTRTARSVKIFGTLELFA